LSKIKHRIIRKMAKILQKAVQILSTRDTFQIQVHL